MAPRLPLDPSEFPPKLPEEVIQKCRKKYYIPKKYKFFQATSHIRAHHNPNKNGKKKSIIIYIDQLEGGLRFHLDPFLKLFFRTFNLAPGQLHPNGYRFFTAFHELVCSHGHEPSVQMHRYMFSLIKKKGDPTYSISCIPGFGLFKKLSDITRDWKNKFFLIEHKTTCAGGMGEQNPNC